MPIIDFGRQARAEAEKASERADGAEKEVRRLFQVQETLVKDILSLREIQRTVTGNEYKDYATAVTAISDKYNNLTDWGCLQAGQIIDLRAAFILGEGVQVSHTTQTRAEAERELDWVDAFFDWNDLDNEGLQEYAKEAEIEGKIALTLFYENEKFMGWPGMVSARYLSWSSKKYTVTADEKDYQWYKELTWKPAGDDPGGTLAEADFIYKKFGGRLNKPNEAQPKIMRCLTQVDRLDKALYDLRKINHLFASPVPYVRVETPQAAKEVLAQAEDLNFRAGKLLAGVGEFQYVSPDVAGVANLISEIEYCIKMISGTTGIPIHFLGLLDLLKNRATGDNTRELVGAATARERKIWIGALEELITKAMRKYNAAVNAQKSPDAGLDPEKVKVDIPLISQDHWDRIANVLIPAKLAGIVSKEHVAEQIPGVDLEAEAERQAEEERKQAENAQTELEMIKANAFNRGDEE